MPLQQRTRKSDTRVSFLRLPTQGRVQRGIINRAAICNARVYMYNVPLLTSVKEVTRFIAMLDFYRPHRAFCRDITALHFYGESVRYFCCFPLANRSAILSRYLVMRMARWLVSCQLHFLKLVTMNLFLTPSSASRNYMQINRFVIIWAFVQHQAHCTSVFRTFLHVSIWPL